LRAAEGRHLTDDIENAYENAISRWEDDGGAGYLAGSTPLMPGTWRSAAELVESTTFASDEHRIRSGRGEAFRGKAPARN